MEDFIDCRIRIAAALRNRAGSAFQFIPGYRLQQLVTQHLAKTFAPMLHAAVLRRNGAHRRQHFRNPLALPRHRLDHRNVQLRRMQLLRQPPGAFAVRLIDDEHVGNLQQPGFHRLNVVAHPRNQHHHRHRRQPRNVHFVLPHANRFHDHHVEAGRIQQSRHVRGRRRQPAHRPPRRHGPDEDIGVGMMLHHPHAVPQNRPARKRAGRIDSHDGDSFPFRPDRLRQLIHQRGFPRPRRAGDAQNQGVPRARK